MKQIDILNSKFNKIKLDNKLLLLKNKYDMVVQSLLFDKDKFTKHEAIIWSKNNGFKFLNTKSSENFIHIRQKEPGRYNTYKTIELSDGIKARVATNINSKFKGYITLKNVSKLSNIKNDLDIKLPVKANVWFLSTGSNRDGNIKREDLEESLPLWNNKPIIGWHDNNNPNIPTQHKMSDRLGYLYNPKLVFKDNKYWIVSEAEIISRKLAYHLYTKERLGNPLEVSPEFSFMGYWENGKKYQSNIRPHLLSIVDKGNVKGNKIKVSI